MKGLRNGSQGYTTASTVRLLCAGYELFVDLVTPDDDRPHLATVMELSRHGTVLKNRRGDQGLLQLLAGGFFYAVKRVYNNPRNALLVALFW